MITQSTKIKLCNIEIDNLTFDRCVEEISRYVEERSNIYIVTSNIDHIVKLQKDKVFFEIYRQASLVLADGMPILWAASFMGTPLNEKISGSDLFPKLCELAARNNFKLFFLGGRAGAANKAADVMRSIYPSIKIAGTYCPPFGFENDKIENDKIIKMIRDVSPDILFVGLGAPKQEKWIYKYRNEYRVPVSIGIGVSFEFVAGMVKRAPKFMQKLGFEWLWRLMMEPKRLWRRYLIDDMSFFGLALKQKFNCLKKPS